MCGGHTRIQFSPPVSIHFTSIIDTGVLGKNIMSVLRNIRHSVPIQFPFAFTVHGTVKRHLPRYQTHFLFTILCNSVISYRQTVSSSFDI